MNGIIQPKQLIIFTNNKQLAVEDGKDNLQVMFQIAYAIKGEIVYIRYDSTTQQEKPCYKEFNAKFINTLDDNSITSDTKTVTLYYPRADYNLKKEAKKITSLDGLPSNDYIWVHYIVTASITEETQELIYVFRPDSGISNTRLLLKETLPSDDCIILDSEMNELTSDTLDYYIQAEYKNTGIPQWSFYIGYPLSEYEGETITNTAKFYGQYREADGQEGYYVSYKDGYSHEIEYIAEKIQLLNIQYKEYLSSQKDVETFLK